MLLQAKITHKIIGNQELFKDLVLKIHAGDKIGLIGRNGVGKTTLFRSLTGADSEFDGEIEVNRRVRIVSTEQEHLDLAGQTAIEYILGQLPEYQELKKIINTYPEKMGDKMHLISRYSDALNRFGELDYYNIENKLTGALGKYQLDEQKINLPMKQLSGGQKRFVDLVRVQFSEPDLALIDEPTNHMDFVAKRAFIDWLEAAPHACLVISHDRDVLKAVDKIIEIKDLRTFEYRGNYDDYLAQNTRKTTDALQNYEIAQNTIKNLKKQIESARAKKPSWSGTADQKNPFVVMENRLSKQLKAVEAANPKPSFWIDQESAAALNPKLTSSYQKHKAKNIRLTGAKLDERSSVILTVENVQVGYNGQPLFEPVSFNLKHGDRFHIVGRNGAGKTTLVRTIMAAVAGKKAGTLISGRIEPGRELRLAFYEQEVSSDLLNLSLYDAVEQIFRQAGAPINRQLIMQKMGDYLFDPIADADKMVSNLSGGQKARLQLIRMLAGSPNLLVLDEPTNHLDLPSIEELENALANYHGAVIYISHDSYFSRNLGGETYGLPAI